MHKLHCKKIMSCIFNSINSDVKFNYDVEDYLICISFIGIYKSLINTVFLFTKVFDIRNLLLNDVIKNMELLCNLGTDFLLTEMLKEDKNQIG